jgi:hypothetical protein
MSSIFGHIYSGPVIDDVNVTDIISFSAPAQANEDSNVFDAAGAVQDPEILRRIEERKGWFFGRKGAQPPITERESEEIGKQVDEAKSELAEIENYIASLQSVIENQIVAQSVDGKEPAIVLNTKNKTSLKRSLRKLFGQDMTRITLSDLKELLAARTALEQAAVIDYARDFPES